MHLSFEIQSEQKTTAELEVFFDREGLEFLSGRLQLLLDAETEHDHLMTPSWAGNELSENAISKNGNLIHKVTITKIG